MVHKFAEMRIANASFYNFTQDRNIAPYSRSIEGWALMSQIIQKKKAPDCISTRIMISFTGQ